ncbi:hypothetical protein MBLNU457_5602t1 [Dothideomycetes sp. NU457]
MASTDQSSSFMRALASSSKPRRDTALSSLRTYLTSKTHFTLLDAQKLQKALFYTLYMQDKPRNQQRLSIALGELNQCFKTNDAGRENFLLWQRAFWETMIAQWGGIDKWRVDKFLFLVRREVFEGLRVLAASGWEEGFVGEWLSVLEETVLAPRDVKIPLSLKLHVVDVWVDEIGNADEERKAPMEKLLAPVRRLASDSVVKSVRNRLKEALEDDRLEEWGIVGQKKAEDAEPNGQNDEEPEGEWTGFDDDE